MENNNKQNFAKPTWQFNLALYSFIIISALMIYGYNYLSSQMILEIPPIMAKVNPNLYIKDFTVQENLLFTPRYYYQNLIAFLVNLGLNFSWSHFVYYIMSFSSFILGLYALGKHFGNSQLSAGILAFLGLMAIEGTVGYVSLFRTEPIPAILAMGFAIWGVYFSFCQRWILGYFFFGLAALIHILIGLLGGVMLAPLLLLNTLKNRRFRIFISAVIIFTIFLGLIYIPMQLTGTTNTGKMSNQEFVYLYGYLRVPHHIIPSVFPIQNWRTFINFMLGGILLTLISDKLELIDKKSIIIVISTAFFCLFLGYIFVEVYPLALVAKMQLARTTPFAMLMVLIVISVLAQEYYQQRNIGLILFLIITATTHNGSFLLFLLAFVFIILKLTNNTQIIQSRLTAWITGVGAILFLVLYPLPSSLTEIINRLFFKFLLLFIFLIPFFLEQWLGYGQKIQVLVYGLSLGTIVFFVLGLAQALPTNLANLFLKNLAITEQPPSNNSLEIITLKFRDLSPQDALIVVPPSEAEFRLYSQRSVVVDFRNFPFSDQGLQEWAIRIKAILGTNNPPLSWRNVDSFYQNRSASDLEKAARSYGANYILTQKKWHPNIKGKIFIQDNKWIIYQLN
ncbi:DUF6798 domain-containing protein [Aphanothece sacrum]|uniref:Transmembrane protein n=1 Tax=Aphanothece sacrum FPU1 TaxID=1920663 RepID=A0A401IIH7_APHSA|nr:DUF6798 domain-containing protein [Aphanothece sacrum]GBF81097.1 transmembrane protein [Aphanothece sacrum FPU1]GBF85498.1 transmembrane protein [Aphanothece sacrum FPU3]